MLDPLWLWLRKDGTTGISPSLESELKDSEGRLDLIEVINLMTIDYLGMIPYGLCSRVEHNTH